MKELRLMSRKERTLISVQCEKFFLSIYKPKAAYPIFKLLKSDLELPARYDKEIWCVVTCVGKSLRAGNNGSQFTMKAKNYTTVNSIHGLGLSRKRATEVICKLDELGWIEYYKGYKNLKKEDDFMRGCIIFSEKLKALFSTKLLNMYSEPVDKMEMIEVKDSKTKEKIMKLTKFKGVTDHRSLMISYNAMLKRHNITWIDVKCATTYKQVFADDLEGAGRFYTFGGLQTTRSELRCFLKINDDVTTEVDIRGIHPAILRLVQGHGRVPDNFDPYDVTNLFTIPDREYRYLCKLCMMCMINCKTRRGSAKALMNIIEEDKSSSEPELINSHHLDVEDTSVIVSLLEEHNDPVTFFGKGQISWKQLQRYDSRVCEGVIKRFIKEDKPVLCWHDSWVCALSDQDFLKRSILDSWYDVFATRDNCILKVEF